MDVGAMSFHELRSELWVMPLQGTVFSLKVALYDSV